MKEKNTSGKSKKQTGLIVLCSVLAVILVLLIVGTAYMESVFGLINRNPDNSTLSSEEYEKFLNEQTETMDPNFTGEVLDPSDVEWEHGGEVLENSDEVINILLIGQDRREGQGRQRSDSMILCTINKKNNSLTMTSFMRDMYVPIPGYRDDRINACYALGGMELLDSCLETNFGIQVDGNVEVDFKGFMKIIDLFGGVDIELTQSEANYLNKYGNWDVSDDHWNLHAGVNTLNGSQALAYSRIRYIGNGDFQRTERQRTVLNKILEKVKNMSLAQANDLLKKILPMVTTDMTNQEIMSYSMAVLPMLSNLKVTNIRIPADGTYKNASIRGMSVLVPDLQANRRVLGENVS